MDVEAILERARDSITVGRVFGEPIERGGITVVPVAFVAGGGGGGGGEDADGSGGSGAGFGVAARPVGAYVIKGDDVRFRPAFSGDALIGAAVALLVGWLRYRQKGD